MLGVVWCIALSFTVIILMDCAFTITQFFMSLVQSSKYKKKIKKIKNYTSVTLSVYSPYSVEKSCQLLRNL